MSQLTSWQPAKLFGGKDSWSVDDIVTNDIIEWISGISWKTKQKMMSLQLQKWIFGLECWHLWGQNGGQQLLVGTCGKAPCQMGQPGNSAEAPYYYYFSSLSLIHWQEQNQILGGEFVPDKWPNYTIYYRVAAQVPYGKPPKNVGSNKNWFGNITVVTWAKAKG